MSRRLPQLTALRAFEAAARHLSFARAAEELHVTPAAISQQIKHLEAYLGVSLFRRGRRLSLSDSAREALPLLSEGFDFLERAVSRLHAGYDDGPLVVSAPPTFASRWLMSRLDDFHTAYPDIDLHLHASRRLVDFAVEEVDVAVRFGPGPYPGLHADRLMAEAIVPVAAPALAAKISTPADLIRHTLLNDDARAWDPTFPDWDTWLSSLGVAGALRIRRFSDSNLVIEAATQGLGVALMWHSLVADELRSGRLQRLFDSILPTVHGYHLVVPPNRLQVPKIAAFREWMLKQALRQAAPG
jgi:LysR family transcriptional regulator, glycine cleavage system transcriptional activator